MHISFLEYRTEKSIISLDYVVFYTHALYSFVLQIFHGFFLTKQDCFLHFAYIELWMSTGKDERWLAGYFFEIC